MQQHQAEYEVKIMCRGLQVSVSGYYAWRKRRLSQRAAANDDLLAAIKDAHCASRQTYGSRRVTAALRQQGRVCNHKRVARLMRLSQLRGCERRKRRVVTTQVDRNNPVAANVVQRNFSAPAPNRLWLGDITYIPTREGFLYLASLEDAFSRQIVGWAMDEHREQMLVQQALQMALNQRQPEDDVLHHSDRGSQYTSGAYQALLAQHHIAVSMSGVGNCYDNALKESFFATLKTECVTDLFDTRLQARSVIFDYIEVFYNRQRLHSALGYLSPEQFERQFFPIP